MCHIGLAMQSMSLVAWDAAISVYLAAAFIWPLLHTIKSSRLKRLAIKSLIASIVSCITSVTNITVLIQMDGELGWLCLSVSKEPISGTQANEISSSARSMYWSTSSVLLPSQAQLKKTKTYPRRAALTQRHQKGPGMSADSKLLPLLVIRKVTLSRKLLHCLAGVLHAE